MDPGQPAVKSRRYDSSGRRAQAARTHVRILDAAQEMLLREGYAGTTVAAIAAAADVSPELIYKRFGGKAGLVRALQQRALRGTGPVPAPTRSDTLAAGTGPAADILRQWATLTMEVSPLVSPIVLLVYATAGTDKELAELASEIDRQRLERMTVNAQRLIHHTGLRPELTVEQIRDVLWTYSSPRLYDLLVLHRSWTLPAYRDFVCHGLSAQLLAPSSEP